MCCIPVSLYLKDYTCENIQINFFQNTEFAYNIFEINLDFFLKKKRANKLRVFGNGFIGEVSGWTPLRRGC